jgi:hypothetical protein
LPEGGRFPKGLLMIRCNYELGPNPASNFPYTCGINIYPQFDPAKLVRWFSTVSVVPRDESKQSERK